MTNVPDKLTELVDNLRQSWFFPRFKINNKNEITTKQQKMKTVSDFKNQTATKFNNGYRYCEIYEK